MAPDSTDPPPRLALPFQAPVEPMLATISDRIPGSDGEPGWRYEPKWDGFRTLVFFDGHELYLQSRDLRPLGRYFPELETGLVAALPGPVVLDGEIVIMSEHGLAFEQLQLRLHPAESRVRLLSEAIPAQFAAFDLLAAGREDWRDRPFAERRDRLEALLPTDRPPVLYRSPSTADPAVAADWFDRFEGAGFDGIIAKREGQPYLPGVRGFVKVKHARTADCVVAGYRWAKGQEGRAVGSLLLGLYDGAGVLHHVGHTSSFTAAEKRALADRLAPLATEDEDAGFGRGRTPGGPSRWTRGKDVSWVRLRPELVCEVRFDHLQGDRFRHGTTFVRWRSDKPPARCTYDQIAAVPPKELLQLLGEGRG